MDGTTSNPLAGAAWRRALLAVLTLLVVATSLPLAARPAAAEQDPDVCTTWWDGGSGTASWHDPGNWDADELPNDDDVVCIEARMAGTRGVTYSEAVSTRIHALHTDTWFQVTGGELAVTDSSATSGLAVDGGRLVVDTALRASDVRQSAGTVAGAGVLDVAGNVVWTGGTQEGPGRTTITWRSDGQGGLYLDGTGERSLTGGRGLEAETGFRWSDGGIVDIDATSYATVGTSTVVADLAQIKGPGAVRATADLVVEGGVLTVDGPLYTDAASTIAIRGADSDLALYGGGDLRGDVTLETGNQLSIQGGTYVVRPEAAIFGDGELFVTSEAHGATDVTVQGQLRVAHTSVLSEADLAVGDASDLGELSIADGHLAVYGNVSAETVVIDGGELWGGGNLAVQGDLTWGTGRMTGPGATTVDGTIRFAGDGAERELSGRSLAGAAADVVDGGSLVFSGADPRMDVAGEFTVAGPDFHVKGVGSLDPGNLTVISGSTVVIDPVTNTNADAELEIGGAGASLTLNGGGEHHGSLDLDDGSLALGGDTTWADGSSLFATGAVTVLPGAKVALAGGAMLGTFVNQGSTTISKDVSAATADNQGSLFVTGDGGLAVLGGDYVQQGEDAWTELVDQNSDLSVEQGQIVVAGGVLGGTGVAIGEVVNGDTLSPSGDGLTVVGRYAQDAEAVLEVTVDGANATGLDVWGPAALDGSVDFEIIGAAPSSPFPVVTSDALSGTFSARSGADACLEIFYSPTDAVAHPSPCGVVAAATAEEGDGTIRFPVTLTGPSDQVISIDYTAVSDSATAGDDFDARSGSITLLPGQTEGLISIPLVDDDQVEGDEIFLLQLDASGAVMASEQVIGTIVDDDEPPVELPDLTFHAIPQSIDVGAVQTMNGTWIAGYHGVVVGEEQYAWAYKLSDGTSGYVPNTRWISDMNGSDHAVVECWDLQACFRKDKVNTPVPTLAGYRAGPEALNDADVLVGALYPDDHRPRAARWATPTDTPALLPGLGGEDSSMAVDVALDGTVAGWSRSGATTRGWVDVPDWGVEELTHPQFTDLEPRAINADGTVVGRMWNGDSTKSNAFLWDGEQVVDLGPGGANDVNAKGQIVGWSVDGSGSHAVTWIGEQRFVLDEVAGKPGYALGYAVAVNDAGAIAAVASGPNGGTPVALTPPGQGCKVCMDFHAEVQQFPNPDVWITTGNETVEGNPVRMKNTLTNNDDEPHTVSVAFFVDGQPHGADEHVVTLDPGESTDVQELWDTNGTAFRDGLSAGPHELQVSLAYEDGIPVQRTTIEMQVNPRPVVMVHGMNSDAETWSSYQSFLAAAHPGWKGFAVDTMDTSSSPPFSIAKNATKLAGFVDTVQRGQNAWQVDLVAHSMGGLISRYYISDLMAHNGGVRAVDRLVMLGTPNAGSPCADLFSTSVTYQLRTDVMAAFNQTYTERQGVPFSVAIGDWMPFTCQSAERGDLVVPVSSAAHGIDDTATYDIAHTDMTGSHELFLQYVLPRLNGSGSGSGVAAADTARQGLAAETATTSTEGSTGEAAAVDGPTTDPNPQLLMSFNDLVAPGASSEASFTVPAGTTAMGAAAQGSGSVEVELIRHDRTVAATTGTDASATAFRAVGIDQPAAEQWLVRVTNHGDQPVKVPLAVWGRGLPNRLEASASQVDETGTVHVTARLTGELPGTLPTTMRAELTPAAAGETLIASLYDDGAHGDGAAGDREYGADVAAMAPQGWSVLVATDYGPLQRWTTTTVDVSLGTDDPTRNDAPKAYDRTVAGERNATTRVELKGTDPEGSPLTYEIVQGPAHGQLGGGGGTNRVEYRPAEDYMGTDSFTYRVHDGELYSPPATVTVVVGREPTQLKYVRPLPAESTTGRTIHGVTVQLVDNALEPIEDAPVQFRFAGQTYQAQTTLNGFTAVNLDGRVAVGTHDLEVIFPGDATHAPTTIHQPFRIVDGGSPVTVIEGPVTAEAQYPENVFVRGNDPDADSVKFELDVDGDGTWDQVSEREPASNGVDYGHTFVVTYPTAFDGTVRARVTDAAGHAVEATTEVHVAPYRPLGALRRLTDERGERLDVGGSGGTTADGRSVLHLRTDDTSNGAGLPLALLDVTTGQDEIVSILPDGSVSNDWPRGVISANGRFVAFTSSVWVGGKLPSEVFLRDRIDGTTVAVSVDGAGRLADWHASPVAVTDDGKVLFASTASNLGTTPPNCGTGGQTVSNCELLWLRDPAAGTTTLVSRDQSGTGIPVDSSTNDMTADGRYVVFADNHRVWLWDATVGHASVLGIAQGGGDSNGSDIGASNFQLSEDGRRVLFNTTGTNIHPDDTSSDLDVYLFDRETGTSTLVSRATSDEKAAGSSYDAVMSGDGTVVAFSSSAANLVAGDEPDTWDVFVRDLTTGVTSRISEEARDHLQPDQESYAPQISCDGRWVLFASDAETIVPGDVNLRRDAFVYDRGAAAARPCDGSTPPPANHAPTATGSTVSTTEDTPVAVALSGADADGDELTYEVTGAPTHGTLSGEGSALTYTPAQDFHGTDSVTFTVSDGQTSSEAASVAITVTSANDAPTAVLVAPATLDEGASAGIDVQAADVDGDTLTYKWATTTGVLTGSGAHVTLSGVDGPAAATVSVTVSDGTESVVRAALVEVHNVAPVAAAGPDVSVPVGTSVTFTGTATDPGPSDTAAGLTGSWSFGDGTSGTGLSASHAYATAGIYTATLTVTDRDGATGQDTVTVTVTQPTPQPKPTPKLVVSTVNGTFGFAAASATLTDPATGRPIPGKVVSFSLDGRTVTATTDAKGAASVPARELRAGAYPVKATVAADDRYGAATASGNLKVTNSTGRVQALVLDQGGLGGLIVSNDGRKMTGVMGWISRYGLTGSCTFDGLGIRADGDAAWVSGRTSNGKAFVIYVEDNGSLFAGRDVFRLWVDGVERTSGSTRILGDVTIK